MEYIDGSVLYPLLAKVQGPNDIKRIPREQYGELAAEIRRFLIDSLSRTGGHLAPNLGVVELTMALHLELDFPEDRLIWDVGHQSYTHKLLTGRREGFASLRKYGGMSGFPKRAESDCDCFDTGHSSTSLSAGLGFVRARDLQGQRHTVVSVIGDGALTGGMAYEALNNAAKLETNYIMVLNDNNYSISENVGGISRYLGAIRTGEGYRNLKDMVYNALKGSAGGRGLIETIRTTKKGLKQWVIPGMFFEDMGITYLGPVNGHNMTQLQKVLQEAKKVPGPVLVHVLTKKGRGYAPAERHPARFHGSEPFCVDTGLPAKKKGASSYTDVFATVMCKLAAREERLVAVSAAMPTGTGLARFANRYPSRFFDVGIAEGHAVTFAAGLAAGGLRPVVAIYSTFLQRAYDQILHDVCIQKLPVVFAIDRAGLVGADGETHQGIFDLSYLTPLPNMCVMAPKNKWELSDMLKFALGHQGPVAIRYPRGEACSGFEGHRAPIELGRGEWIEREGGIALFALGSMLELAAAVAGRLRAQGYRVSLFNARFAKPVDRQAVVSAACDHSLLVSLEENVRKGGFGEAVGSIISDRALALAHLSISLPDGFVEHGAVDILKEKLGLSAEAVCQRIREAYGQKGEAGRTAGSEGV